METQKIEAHKIKKPIQLMAVWFITLVLIDSAFLTAAVNISTPSWLSPTLVISAIVFVPLFLLGVFLMQTVFRKELQEDQFYSEWLKRQEKLFKNFKPDTIQFVSKQLISQSNPDDDLEALRIENYEKNKGIFLIHTWRPSSTSGQVADIVIQLHQHNEGPLSYGKIEKVEYTLGPMFFNKPIIKTNSESNFRLEVSAYGPMLCYARVYFKNGTSPLLLSRYVNLT